MRPFERYLSYEEIRKGSMATSQSLNRLLYMSKSDRVYAEDSQKIEKYLRMIGGECAVVERKEKREELVQFLNFCIKYIRSIEVKQFSGNTCNYTD